MSVHVTHGIYKSCMVCVIHSRPRVQTGWLVGLNCLFGFWLSLVIMEEEHFQALMEKIKKSRKEVEGNLSSSISELKKELTSGNDLSTRENLAKTCPKD